MTPLRWIVVDDARSRNGGITAGRLGLAPNDFCGCEINETLDRLNEVTSTAKRCSGMAPTLGFKPPVGNR